MILSKLIQKGGLHAIATAIHATPVVEKEAVVAEIAAVAVAMSQSAPDSRGFTQPEIQAMSEKYEGKIIEWLKNLGEIDAEEVDSVLSHCRSDPEVLQYYLKRALSEL